MASHLTQGNKVPTFTQGPGWFATFAPIASYLLNFTFCHFPCSPLLNSHWILCYYLYTLHMFLVQVFPIPILLPRVIFFPRISTWLALWLPLDTIFLVKFSLTTFYDISRASPSSSSYNPLTNYIFAYLLSPPSCEFHEVRNYVL